MTPLRIYLLAAAVLVTAVGAYSGWRAFRSHQVASHLKKADQLDTMQACHGAKAETHEQEAEALTPRLQEDDAEVARARAEVDRLEVHHAGFASDPADATWNAPAEHLQAAVVLAPLDAAKDQLISALTKNVADLKLANTALALADQERQAQVNDLKAEVAQLRAGIAARPSDLRWAAGAVYGTTAWGDTAKGAFIDRDFTILRTGAELTRNSYVLANRQGWEIRVRAGVRF